ncbi:MAG TPA: 30S ribosomal protein THX [Rhodanobacteraceae bacterium]
MLRCQGSAISAPPPACPALTRIGGAKMGKGDRRTTRGKIYRGSHGNARPHHARVHVEGKTVAKSGPRRAGTRRK